MMDVRQPVVKVTKTPDTSSYLRGNYLNQTCLPQV